MHLRAQSAMEYLMTYGWAIVAIGVVIAVFYSLGIFGLGSNGASGCVVIEGFSCSQPVLSSSGILTMGIGQIGSTKTITATGCSQNDSAPSAWQVASVPLASGQVSNVSFSCPSTAGAPIGTQFKATLWIQYATNTQSGSITITQQVAQISSVVVSTPVFQMTDRGSATEGDWQQIASSASGQDLVAVSSDGGNILTSGDYGVNWNDDQNPGSWGAVASDASGQYLIAATTNGGAGAIWTSSSYGAGWNSQGGLQSWDTLTSSASGANLTASAATVSGRGGAFITSNDFGAQWSGPLGVCSGFGCTTYKVVASSADGSHLVAAYLGSSADLVTSSNYGVTWTDRAHSGNWAALASSSNGQYLIAAQAYSLKNGGNGEIYISNDYGVTWTQLNVGGAPEYWASVASSSDGSHLVAAQNGGDIFTSINYGAAWVDQGYSGDWQSVALSADGMHISAAQSGGDIWTGTT